MKRGLIMAGTYLGITFLFTYSTVDIYVMRHGSTDKNKHNVFVYGEDDLPLNQKGIQEIEAIASQLEKKPEVLYVSPQKRALQTAEILVNKTRSRIIPETRLRERDYTQDGHRESKESQSSRVLNFIKEKANIFTRRIWTVSHGGVIGGLLGQAGVTKRMPIKNGSIFVFRYNKIFNHLSFRHILKI